MPVSPIGEVGRTVGANIRRLRHERGLSREKLAPLLAAAGRPTIAYPSSISRGEAGLQRISVDDLVAYAAALQVNPTQLLTPHECGRCHGTPPAGFTCRGCGVEGT